MKQYIDKTAIVAEINRIKDAENESINSFEHQRNTSERKRYNARMALLGHILSFLDSLEVKEEPVSEDLEEAYDSYYDETWDEHGGRAMVVEGYHDIWFPSLATNDFFKAGAKWQEEQFEKNRIEHCDNMTEEQYNLESEFIDQHIKKYHRIPTILDAIEYGMSLKKGV